jgi:hypothetical protein
MTDPARLNLDSDRSRLGFADLLLYHLEVPTGVIHAYSFHRLASSISALMLFEP